MLKILYADFLCLSLGISSQFTLEMCAAAKNCEKFYIKLFFEGSRSFKVIDVDKSKRPVTSACYDKQHVCCLYLSATVFTLYKPITAK